MKALVPPPLFPLNGDAATLFGPPLGAAPSSPPFRTVTGDVEAAVSCVFTGREYAGGGSHNHGGGRIPCVFCSGASVTVQAQRETEGETYVGTSKIVSGWHLLHRGRNTHTHHTLKEPRSEGSKRAGQ